MRKTKGRMIIPPGDSKQAEGHFIQKDNPRQHGHKRRTSRNRDVAENQTLFGNLMTLKLIKRGKRLRSTLSVTCKVQTEDLPPCQGIRHNPEKALNNNNEGRSRGWE